MIYFISSKHLGNVSAYKTNWVVVIEQNSICPSSADGPWTVFMRVSRVEVWESSCVICSPYTLGDSGGLGMFEGQGRKITQGAPAVWGGAAHREGTSSCVIYRTSIWASSSSSVITGRSLLTCCVTATVGLEEAFRWCDRGYFWLGLRVFV